MKKIFTLALILFAMPLIAYGDEQSPPDTWSEIYLEEIQRADTEYETALRAANKEYFDFLRVDHWYEPKDRARTIWLKKIRKATTAWRIRKEKLWNNHAACIHPEERTYNEATKQADLRCREMLERANHDLRVNNNRDAWYHAVDSARLQYVATMHEAWATYIKTKETAQE